MRVLLTGATGFIGSAIFARLRSDGHFIVATSRRPPNRAAMDDVEWIELDFARIAASGKWPKALNRVDAVVNCAGVLQSSSEVSRSVHFKAPSLLFAACEAAGVKRVIHFSAIGVDKTQLTDFSRTKLEGDKALSSRGLDWVILRPSLVVGRGVFGGSALIRTLAATPLMLIPRRDPELQIVQLEDVVETVLFFLRSDAPSRVILDVAGPKRMRLSEIALQYRRWLRFPEPAIVRAPDWLIRAAVAGGNAAAALGWPSALRTTAFEEMSRGAVGDNSEWQRITGIKPVALEDALSSAPAGVQDRWHARLATLRPLLFITLAAFWIGTGLISIGPGFDVGVDLMKNADARPPLDKLTVIAGGFADILIGLALLARRTVRTGLYAAIAISLFYFIMGTILLPELWLDPIGPMLKIWPLIFLHMMALAILDER